MTNPVRPDLPDVPSERPEDLGVVAVDMDGTFLGTGFPPRYDRIRFAPLRRRMREAGVRFVVASGNQEAQLLGYFDGVEEGVDLAPDGVISDSGAIVLADGRRLLETSMSQEALGAVVEVLAAHPGVGLVASGPRGALIPEDQDETMRRVLAFYHPNSSPVPTIRDVLGHGVSKLAMVDLGGFDPALTSRLQAVLGDDVVAVTSGHESIDLIVPGRHKAFGMDVLLEHWGLGTGQVAAFGDSQNDAELLAHVGYGIAMANGSPAAMASARYLAPSNATGGVMTVLEAWFPAPELSPVVVS